MFYVVHYWKKEGCDKFLTFARFDTKEEAVKFARKVKGKVSYNPYNYSIRA